jgi:hypothetical protein
MSLTTLTKPLAQACSARCLACVIAELKHVTALTKALVQALCTATTALVQLVTALTKALVQALCTATTALVQLVTALTKALMQALSTATTAARSSSCLPLLPIPELKHVTSLTKPLAQAPPQALLAHSYL